MIITHNTEEWVTIIEEENGDTCALRVINGWIYRVREYSNQEDGTPAVALTFVLDTRK